MLCAVMRTPKAVIFDCDGVLVDSEVLALEVELELLSEYGLAYDRIDYATRFLGRSTGAWRALLDEDCRARTGRPLAGDFLHRNHERLSEAVRERLTEVAGCAAAVAALALPKAVASSSGAAFLRDKLARTGLLAAFDPHVYSADLVARAKPHPDIFLHAAAALGAAPERCLAIEDSVNGVAAARAAGMTVWGFTGGGHCDEGAADRLAAAGADRVVRHWNEAAVLFAGFGRPSDLG